MKKLILTLLVFPFFLTSCQKDSERQYKDLVFTVNTQSTSTDSNVMNCNITYGNAVVKTGQVGVVNGKYQLVYTLPVGSTLNYTFFNFKTTLTLSLRVDNKILVPDTTQVNGNSLITGTYTVE